MNIHAKDTRISVTTGPLPASRKIYVEGGAGVRAPLREVSLHDSANEPPVRLYDTSGPYTDPEAEIDIYKGLPRNRRLWVQGRGDVEEYRSGVDILSNPEIRANLPKYANWPTFPQLWVDGELIGGCDIVTEMFESGELQSLIKETAAAQADS